jgi:hypothetical protein
MFSNALTTWRAGLTCRLRLEQERKGSMLPMDAVARENTKKKSRQPPFVKQARFRES